MNFAMHQTKWLPINDEIVDVCATLGMLWRVKVWPALAAAHARAKAQAPVRRWHEGS